MSLTSVITLTHYLKTTRSLEEFTMHGEVDSKGMVHMLTALAQNVSLLKVDISYNHFYVGQNVMRAFSNFIAQNKTVEHFTMDGCFIHWKKRKLMIDLFLRNTSLQSFSIEPFQAPLPFSSVQAIYARCYENTMKFKKGTFDIYSHFGGREQSLQNAFPFLFQMIMATLLCGDAYCQRLPALIYKYIFSFFRREQFILIEMPSDFRLLNRPCHVNGEWLSEEECQSMDEFEGPEPGVDTDSYLSI